MEWIYLFSTKIRSGLVKTSFFWMVMMIPSKPVNDRIYSHEEIQCSYTYLVTKQWMLELKEQGTFHLKFSRVHSDYGKKRIFDVIGTWEKRNDTIILTASAPIVDECSYRTVTFVFADECLKPIDRTNLCLPAVLKPGIRFLPGSEYIY
jgi:hypothetical protein